MKSMETIELRDSYHDEHPDPGQANGYVINLEAGIPKPTCTQVLPGKQIFAVDVSRCGLLHAAAQFATQCFPRRSQIEPLLRQRMFHSLNLWNLKICFFFQSICPVLAVKRFSVARDAIQTRSIARYASALHKEENALADKKLHTNSRASRLSGQVHWEAPFAGAHIPQNHIPFKTGLVLRSIKLPPNRNQIYTTNCAIEHGRRSRRAANPELKIHRMIACACFEAAKNSAFTKSAMVVKITEGHRSSIARSSKRERERSNWKPKGEPLAGPPFQQNAAHPGVDGK